MVAVRFTLIVKEGTELAFVFQDFYLLDSLTVKENIMMPLILNEEDAAKSAKIADKVAKKLGSCRRILKELDKGKNFIRRYCGEWRRCRKCGYSEKSRGNIAVIKSIVIK